VTFHWFGHWHVTSGRSNILARSDVSGTTASDLL
jgi:hypothetical protein